MDKQSHFSLGMNSQQILDSSFNFNEIANCDKDASASFTFRNDQFATSNAYERLHEFQNITDDTNWKMENVECKQELDPMSFINNPSMEMNDSMNYGSESELNESYQYAYNQVPSTFENNSNGVIASGHSHKAQSVQEHRMGPYHISSTKNQLPSWYHPPGSSSFVQESTYHQHPFAYQGSFMGPTQQSPMDSNMRNMIHLNNRYLNLL